MHKLLALNLTVYINIFTLLCFTIDSIPWVLFMKKKFYVHLKAARHHLGVSLCPKFTYRGQLLVPIGFKQIGIYWGLLLLLHIRSAHMEILEFPMGGAYQYSNIFGRVKTMWRMQNLASAPGTGVFKRKLG